MGELGNVFEGLEDPRRINGQHHSLHDILVIVLCTLMCGGETCTDMALFGQAKRGVSGVFSEAGKGDSQPRYLFPGIPVTGPRSLPLLVSGIHEPFCRKVPRGGGRRQQILTPVLRPG